MWQATRVADLLMEKHGDLQVAIVPVRTLGDRDRSTALAGLGQSGIFTKEVEQALLDESCDVAVHSYKDLPTRLEPGLALAAVMQRADPRDSLVSRSGLSLGELPPGSVVGTSSLRRRSLLLRDRPDLVVANLRGNVPTRLRAVGVDLEEGTEPAGEPLEATILAHAGLVRLGLDSHATEILSPDRFLPAPAQGAVAVEIRADDSRSAEILAPLDDAPTRAATLAERTFLEVMEGGCHVPLGALARVVEGGLELRGVVCSLDGKRAVEGVVTGDDPRAVGKELAEDLLGRGADEILAEMPSRNPG